MGFLSSANHQYGRNYQVYGMEVFAKEMVQKHKRNTDINTEVFSVYKINYLTSLKNCHQLMMSSFLSFIVGVETTGEFSHLLSFPTEDNILLLQDRR